MTVFLRWGIFGLLAVAALLYAYNASKRLSTRKASEPPAALSAPVPADETPIDPSISAPVHVDSGEPEVPLEQMSAKCLAEYLVAQRALVARRDNEPLDRVLRSQHVAFEQNESRRRRLQSLAREWYEGQAMDPDDPEVRRIILRRCRY
jgi:hypothetical protein